MLPVAHRMRNSAEFRTTVRSGRRVGAKTVVVYTHPGTECTRVGFIVSRQVGNAVVRNRVKRRLRHLVRPLIKGHSPAAVVVRALPAAASQSERLADDLKAAYQKAVGIA